MEVLACIFAVIVFGLIGMPLMAFIYIFWLEKVVGPVFDFFADLVDL